MSLITDIRTNMKKRAQYNETVRQLEALDANMARDLDIDPQNIRRMARQAVYG